jgi:toxin HigB-1
MIISFRDSITEDIFHGNNTKKARKVPIIIWSIAFRKLDMVNMAHRIGDLKIPPANRLKVLGGRLKGFCSIRINDQYRVIFKWSNGNAYDVQITDYH